VFEEGEARTSHSGHVRFGLGAIKGVGDKAIDAIVRERVHRAPKEQGGAAAGRQGERAPYLSLFDFCERVPVGGVGGTGGAVNKATIEALIKSGAMDCLHGRKGRSAMLASIEAAVAAGVSTQRDKASGQSSLFGFGASAPPTAEQRAGASALARVPAWSESETLVFEKETLGFYVSSHPLDQHRALISRFANCTTRMIREQQVAQDARVVLGVCVQALRTIMLKAGKNAGGKMGVVMLEDKDGAIEAVAFTDVFTRHADLLQTDQIIFVQGSADYTRGQPQVRIERVFSLEQGQLALVKRVRLIVDEGRLNGSAEAALDRVASLLSGAASAPANGKTNGHANGNGNGRPAAPDFVGLEIVIKTSSGALVQLTGPKKALAVTADLVGALGTALGQDNVQTLGPEVEKAKPEPKKWERR
jgi:DNA polymerase III subunit alpha